MFIPIIIGSLLIALTSAQGDGFTTKSCSKAEDCYVLKSNLHLACYNNVGKCKCSSTIDLGFADLSWSRGQCLMSRYGPCGKNVDGSLEVGCKDGFQCIENTCRDPKEPKILLGAHEFSGRSCGVGSDGRYHACNFAPNPNVQLQLSCNDNNKCSCAKPRIADGRSSIWDLRNYEGNFKCSVGKFGPCGEDRGIRIDCHAPGTSCVNGRCLNPSQLKSRQSEPCEVSSDCVTGLICGYDRICVQPKSGGIGSTCYNDEECKPTLKCTGNGPWSAQTCKDPNQPRSDSGEDYDE